MLSGLPRGWAPTLRLLVDVGGWRLIGTEYVHGRRAVLTPGSADVETVAHALASIAVNPEVARSTVMTAPNLAYSMAADEPWARLRALAPVGMDPWTAAHLADFAYREPVAAAMCSGPALAHTAIDPAELVVEPSGVVCVLDWRHAHLGHPWADLAALAVLLIEHGHDPAEAEKVVSRNPVWRTTYAMAITSQAVQTYGRWELRRHTAHHVSYPVKGVACVGDAPVGSVRCPNANLNGLHHHGRKLLLRMRFRLTAHVPRSPVHKGEPEH